MKITAAGTVVGSGEGSPLYNPGSKLYYWEGERVMRESQQMGWEKEKKSSVLLLLAKWSVGVCSDLSDQNLMNKARNQIHLKNGSY